MERGVARAPSLAGEGVRLAAAALVHEAPALQAKLIKTIGKLGVDTRVREELRRYLPGIAASNRAALQNLLGDADAAPASSIAAVKPAQRAHRVLPTAPERRIEPIVALDELVQLVAYVFENDTDTDAFEQALCGLAMAAPIASDDLAGFGPVLKRAAKLRTPLAQELGRMLLFACHGARTASTPVRDYFGKDSRVHALLIARVDDLIELSAQGLRVAPLSMPTHRRGVIAPAALVARLQEHRRTGARTSLREQALAILRVDPVAGEIERQALRAMPDEPLVRALRHALGDNVAPEGARELFCAAARIRHPRADDPELLRAYGDLGPDGPAAARYDWEVSTWTSGDRTTYTHHDLVVRVAGQALEESPLLAVARHPPRQEQQPWGSWSNRFVAGEDAGVIGWWATTLPSDLEAFFAEGARELGGNIDWWSARWHNKVYLQTLLDPTVDVGPMGLLMLACGLGGKEPGQTALAVDAFAAMRAEGRLDVGAFVATLGRLLATPLVKATRYRKAFDAALRLDPTLADTLTDVLVPALGTAAATPPKDVAKLLELVHELMLAGGRRLDAGERAALAAMKLGGVGNTILKRILALA
jgi:hypothetical protein